MTLTPDQARRIAAIAGWQQAGNLGGCYADDLGNGTLIHGTVTERGFFDLLRVCEEHECYVNISTVTKTVTVRDAYDLSYTIDYIEQGIPTALALAMLEALEVT